LSDAAAKTIDTSGKSGALAHHCAIRNTPWPCMIAHSITASDFAGLASALFEEIERKYAA
jgi:hypothetical protein